MADDIGSTIGNIAGAAIGVGFGLAALNAVSRIGEDRRYRRRRKLRRRRNSFNLI
jgi:membrane protein YqaA with SNARE-associated domain